MAALKLFESKIALSDPPSPKTHPRTKHEVDRITRCRDMAIRVCWGHMDQHFGGRGGRRGSAMAPLERAMVVSYLHCDRCAIFNHSAAICDRMSPTLKSTGGWVTLGPNLGVFPLEQTRHVGVAKSEHPRLTNGETIFEEFQPM